MGLTGKEELSRIQKGRMRDNQGRGHCRRSKRDGCGINREGSIVADPKGADAG